jgi:hypothetical protein
MTFYYTPLRITLFLGVLLSGSLQVFSQAKPQYSKPILIFDNASMKIARPSFKVSALVEKLHRERGLNEAVSAVADKKGMIRMAFLPSDGVQTNCTSYADMYFDKQEKWLSTEEYFSLEPDSSKGLGNIMAKIEATLKAKKFKVGYCQEGGKYALWKITTPANTWYECEIFKANATNTALAIKIDKDPFQVPNLNIYGTAYFDEKGTFVKIQPKSKVKSLNPDLLKTAANQ